MPRMSTTQLVLGLGLGRAGDDEGELVVSGFVPDDDRAVGAAAAAGAGVRVGVAEWLCRWLATGTRPVETTRLTADPFETCVSSEGFVEITSFFGTDADGA